jgi:uncharacterized protein
MRALVLDTNVLISAALADASMPGRVLNRVLDHYVLAQTRDTFRELRDVLASGKISSVLPRRPRNRFLDRITRGAAFFRIEPGPPISRDPADDVYLHLAVTCRAAAIVTGDRDLLVLGEFAGIPILSPSRFLRVERSIRRGRRERGD